MHNVAHCLIVQNVGGNNIAKFGYFTGVYLTAAMCDGASKNLTMLTHIAHYVNCIFADIFSSENSIPVQ